SLLFLFQAPAPTHISTLSLHDALPIYLLERGLATVLSLNVDPLAALLRREDPGQRRRATVDDHGRRRLEGQRGRRGRRRRCTERDRKSTRLNSSHVSISYAVFCLKKKK